MHRLKFFTIFIVFGLLFTLSSDPAYSFVPNPEDDIIAISLLATKRSNVEVGSIIEVYIVIKNFANFTLSNVTINQSLDSLNALQFTESPVGYFNGTARSYSDVSLVNYITGNNITAKSFNITPSNFSLNIDKLDFKEELTFRFKVNVTESGSLSIPATTLTYFDHFGDPVGFDDPITSVNDIKILAIDIPSNDKEGYFPEIEVDEVNYRTIMIISLILLAVALLSRAAYKKKPIE